MWLSPSSCKWLTDVTNRASMISPAECRNSMFDFPSFSVSLGKLAPKQWKRNAIRYCQSTCTCRVTQGTTDSIQDYQLITPGFIGTHWVVKIQGQHARASQLILSGSWRWAREFRKYSKVSKTCSSCKVLDTMSHLLFDCCSLAILRNQLVLFLSDLKIIPASNCNIREVMHRALCTRDGCELFNTFCSESLRARKARWESDLIDILNNNSVPEVTLSFYGLYL
jgi:hypothetical protein